MLMRMVKIVGSIYWVCCVWMSLIFLILATCYLYSYLIRSWLLGMIDRHLLDYE